MYDLRRFFPAQYLACRALVCGLGLAAFSLSAFAQTDVSLTYADQISRRFLMESRGNEIWASFQSPSSVKTFPPAPGAPTVPVAVGLSPSAAEIKRYASANTKYGHIPFTVAQKVSVGKLATGVGALLSVATGGFAGVAMSVAAPFVYDWLTDAGLSADSSGAFTQQVTVNTYKAFDGRVSEWYTGDIVTICNQVNTSYITGFNDPTYTVDPSESPVSCNMKRGGQNIAVSVAFVSSALTTQPITQGQFESALLASPRTTSEIEKILSETIKYPEIQPDPVDWVRIDPVTPGEPIKSPTKTDKKTTTNPDGSNVEETKSCWVKGTVQTGASLKLTEVCNTDTVTKSPSGTVTGTTTATTESETADAAEPVKEDSGFCETLVGKLVCSDLDTPEAEPIDKTTKTLTYSPENHFGGGSCPADQVMTTHNGQTLKVWDWVASCDKINQFFRPLFLTLCAFTALMILAPAVKEA